MAKPFIKWVGGKRQLIEQMLPLFPSKKPLSTPSPLAGWKGKYYEPFLGGGAVFFALQERGLSYAILNDYNAELINLYRSVQNDPTLLDTVLNKAPFSQNNPSTFQSIRQWDRLANWPNQYSSEERAARFIYLNRTAFNGLWRVNQKNNFNVPYGKYKNPGFPTLNTLKDSSQALAIAILTQGDFEHDLKNAQPGDFVYLDPPYVPLNPTSSFTSYTDKGFEDKMQERLAAACERLTALGVAWALSNSDCAYTRTLYGALTGVTLHTVKATRSINHQASGRGKINEILVVGPHLF